MQLSEDQLRDYAMRVAWEMLPEDQKELLLNMARASISVADEMQRFLGAITPQDLT